MCLIGVVEGAAGSGSRFGAGGGGALALTGAHGSTGVSPVVSQHQRDEADHDEDQWERRSSPGREESHGDAYCHS